METLARLNAEDDVTIVQVTHSETLAQYGERIIELDDGWIEADHPVEAETAVPAE
jgi:ABC-type lipoprotein export system ATPase subunit